MCSNALILANREYSNGLTVKMFFYNSITQYFAQNYILISLTLKKKIKGKKNKNNNKWQWKDIK